MTQKRTSRLFLSVALAGIIAAPVLAQAEPSIPDNMLTRSLNNMPRDRGAKMANEIAGAEVFHAEEGVKDKVEAAPAADLGKEEVAREYLEDGDPITQNAIRLLDESGVIGRQRALAESMIIMDQQLRFNDKLVKLLVALGPDAEIEVAPGVFKSFENTPAGIRARIEFLKLQQELAKIASETGNSGIVATGRSDAGGRGASEAPGAALIRDPETARLARRDDGTGYQALGRKPVGQAEQPDPADRISELLKQAEQRLAEQEEKILRNVVQTSDLLAERKPAKAGTDPEASDSEAPLPELQASDISLREIYGSSGVLAAIIDVNGERSEVRRGDEVSGFVVSRIGVDFIEVTRAGSSTRISF